MRRVTAERVAERPLENTANNFSPFAGKTASDLRERRYLARSILWRESGLDRVRSCGRWSVVPGGNVAVRQRGKVAGFAGVATCGSVWADPVCNAKIMASRRLEICSAVGAWQQDGGRIGFVTLTMRHRKGQRLSTLWGALSKAWNRVTAGKGWKTDKARHGVAGWLRVVEVTHGRNGWHVHIHCLVFFEPALTDPDVAGLHGSMFGRWASGLRSAGLARPLKVGQDAKLIAGAADSDLARYFTKAVHGGTDSERIALEFTAAQTKAVRSEHGTRPVWALLDAVHLDGDADALDLWREWERASKGRRQLTWSQGLRDRLGLTAERTDEEIAEQEIGSSDDDLVWITSAGWSRVNDLRLWVPILAAVERGGLREVSKLLIANEIEYRLPGEQE